MVRLRSWLVALAVLAFLVSGTLLTSGLAQGGLAPYRTRNQHLGVSGGNVNDRTSRFCCSGTLGSLVTDGTTQYILSNNHVMGRSGGAAAGEDISQPGMIDANCAVTTVVADFTISAPFSSNVDASIAQLRAPGPNSMDATGFIQGVGVPSSTVVPATVGLAVTKSGRTTGTTTGTVTSINTSVSVQYQQNCGSGKKFNVSYTGQVVVGGSSFSAGGDSGSLIVSSGGKNPVALLYAGSSTSTIGNPAGQVLQRLSAALGRTLTFVGSGGGGNSPSTQNGKSVLDMQPHVRGFGGLMPQLPEQAADRASAALEANRAMLMATPGVIGAGVGSASDNDLEPAIVIYVDRTSSHRPVFAPSLDGITVRIVHTDPFVAF